MNVYKEPAPKMSMRESAEMQLKSAKATVQFVAWYQQESWVSVKIPELPADIGLQNRIKNVRLHCFIFVRLVTGHSQTLAYKIFISLPGVEFRSPSSIKKIIKHSFFYFLFFITISKMSVTNLHFFLLTKHAVFIKIINFFY